MNGISDILEFKYMEPPHDTRPDGNPGGTGCINFENLPDHVLETMACYLPLPSLAQFKLTCHRFNTVTNSMSFWEQRMHRRRAFINRKFELRGVKSAWGYCRSKSDCLRRPNLKVEQAVGDRHTVGGRSFYTSPDPTLIKAFFRPITVTSVKMIFRLLSLPTLAFRLGRVDEIISEMVPTSENGYSAPNCICYNETVHLDSGTYALRWRIKSVEPANKMNFRIIVNGFKHDRNYYVTDSNKKKNAGFTSRTVSSSDEDSARETRPRRIEIDVPLKRTESFSGRWIDVWIGPLRILRDGTSVELAVDIKNPVWYMGCIHVDFVQVMTYDIRCERDTACDDVTYSIETVQ